MKTFLSLLFLTSIYSNSSWAGVVYDCKLDYWITNGGILTGGGKIDVRGERLFALEYPEQTSLQWVEVDRHFYVGIYNYDNKVIIEMKIFEKGKGGMSGLITVVNTHYPVFEKELYLSSIARFRENIELYNVSCKKIDLAVK